jgi:hypothetical protein
MASEPRGKNMPAYLEEEFEAELLSGKVIRASDALACCHNAERKLEIDIIQLLNVFLGWIQNGKPGEVLAFVPSPQTPPVEVPGTKPAPVKPPVGPKWYTIPAEEAVALGLIVLLAFEQLAEIAQSTAAINLLVEIIKAIGTLMDNRGSWCFPCIASKTLSQSNPRRREEHKGNIRVGHLHS